MSSAPSVSPLQVVAWEVTRACPLACLHCRAEAVPEADPRQLSTAAGFSLLSEVAAMGAKVVILTGGEPLTRPDIFELVDFGARQGLRMAVSPDDGRLLTRATAARLRESGVERISFSLHYPDPADNDSFARTPGAFAAALEGLANLRAAGVPFQINTTVSRDNADRLTRMYELVRQLEPIAWDLFFLVPTGRARDGGSLAMPAEQYERALDWLCDLQARSSLEVKSTCAPQHRRVTRQRARREGGATGDVAQPAAAAVAPARRTSSAHGCMCGNGFAFVSHVGEVRGCGYLPLSAGSVRESSFAQIYQSSPLFASLRDPARLGGKCGRCEYRAACGGCRARAFGVSGDYLGEDPACVYEPEERT